MKLKAILYDAYCSPANQGALGDRMTSFKLVKARAQAIRLMVGTWHSRVNGHMYGCGAGEPVARDCSGKTLHELSST